MTTTPHTDAPPGRRYCIVTPCRNEAEYVRATLDSISAQTVPPACWIIVDDGSTDETPAILAEYAEKLPYLRPLRREDRGVRVVGAGVIEAFEDGLATVDLADFDYVCKLDGDLDLPPRYFERAMERMEADPLLGNLSGKLFERQPDGSVEELVVGDENALGAAKFYRVSCFEQIGGFVTGLCWDGIDGHQCRLHGWIAQSVDDPEMRIMHLRPMGSSDRGLWVGRQRWGRGKYFMGSAWYFVAAVAAYRMLDRPYGVGGIGIALGYLRAWLERMPRYESPGFRAHLRRYELDSLVRGKRRTLDRFDARIRDAARTSATTEAVE